MLITRNLRNDISPNDPTFSEIALPERAADYTHACIHIWNAEAEYESDKVIQEDMAVFQKRFGGEVVEYTGKEWYDRCVKMNCPNKQPVGAQFSKRYSFLLFNMAA